MTKLKQIIDNGYHAPHADLERYTMTDPRLYISHGSALFYWRTNPPIYVLDGLKQKNRKPRDCPKSIEAVQALPLSEKEFGPDPIDVLVSPGEPRAGRPRLKHHLQRAKLPINTLCPLYSGIHVASPELCLVQMCATRTFVEALEIGMELCGTYALRPEGIEDSAVRSYTLINAATFAKHVNAWKDLHGLAAARRAARYLLNGSASPMETKLYLLLCLPQKYGGYNLGKPEFNVDVEVPQQMRKSLKQKVVRPDLFWRNEKVVVEYDGAYHDDKRQAARDALRKSVFESMGYTVYTFKRWHVYDNAVFAEMVESMASKLGKRIRPLTKKQALARSSLRGQLLSTHS